MRYLLNTILLLLLILLINSCGGPPQGGGQSNSSGMFLPIIVIIVVIVLVIVSQKKKSETEVDELPDFSSINNKGFSGFANQVVKLNFKGGIIGFLVDNPHKALQKRILQENKNGWRVVQVIPDISGNLFVSLFRLILLIITLFLYTQANGYFIILEKSIEKSE